MRRPYIVGNWKMNGLLESARHLVRALCDGVSGSGAVDVGIAPPFQLLVPLAAQISGRPVELGAQNVFYEKSGAFTGEISPAMLVDAGCRFVIVGHSERRQIFGEAGQWLQKKVFAAVAAGLKVIYCIGETLAQRDAQQTLEVLERQLSEVLTAELDWKQVTIAYEPIWAIGTGRNATPDQAQDAHAFIRGWLRQRYGHAAAQSMRIQYGGSVKPDNAVELLSAPDVDGALVGGASLKVDDFLKIIQSVTWSS